MPEVPPQPLRFFQSQAQAEILVCGSRCIAKEEFRLDHILSPEGQQGGLAGSLRAPRHDLSDMVRTALRDFLEREAEDVLK